MKKKKIFLLESNVDDCTPEEAASVLERLMEEGARDAHILPALMKKGRPGFLIRVVADDPERFSRILMEETGSLGVRFIEMGRFEADRKEKVVEVRIGGRWEKVRVKVSEFGSKPEFDDVRRIARKRKKPAREVAGEVEKQL